MIKYQNPLKTLTKFEWILLISSIVIVTVCFLCLPEKNILTLIATLFGVVGLIFIAKGDPIGQIIVMFFSLFYSFISYQNRYYGELITYLFMSTPSAIASAIVWFKNPSKRSANEVKIKKLTKKNIIFLTISSIIVTAIFYFILKHFNTQNLIISTISITTSFVASILTFMRSPYYGLAYGANDVVLIVLWVLVSINNVEYVPMIICFVVFLINDSYGFYNWRKINKKQNEN